MVVTAVALCGLTPGISSAAPFVPKSDDEVVERLTTRISSTQDRQDARRLREQLQRDPAQLQVALQLARRAIEQARASGDPRELGQAQAALAHWWAQTDPPPAVQLLRAIVLQSRHDFAPALRDLDSLLQPGSTAPLEVSAQAELTRASVLQVQGRWSDAEAACQRLIGPGYAALGGAVRLPAQVCLADLKSLKGDTATAERTMTVLARLAGEGADGAWLALVRAEMAERRGDAAAGTLFEQALQGGGDVYTLGAYADWLLDHGQPAEVIRLLAGREAVDPLLLRLAIAYRRANDARAPAAIATLAARFEAARLRGDASHGREASRFALELADDPKTALVQAQANWAVQREPADGLALLKAARAATQPATAEPVLKFVRDTGWTDVRIAAATSTQTATAASTNAGRRNGS